MKLLIEKSVRQELWLFAGVTILLSCVLLIISPLLSLGSLISGTIAFGVHYLLLRRRVREIAALSDSLGDVLRGEGSMLMEQYTEGELSILHSELQKLLQQLQSAKLSAVEEKERLADSLADISHQLRTPLTSIELIVEMLRSPSLPQTRRQDLYRELSRRTEQLQWLVESLLKLSQLDAGSVKLRMERVQAEDLIEAASASLMVSMELREIRFRSRTNGESLVCDKLWTAEAIGNLLKNAIEHSPTGGTVEIVAEDSPVYLQMTIRDEGPGISEQDLPHLFERFYRGSNAAKGSYGIGLSLSRRILSEENATVRASNAPQGGAVFTLRFYKSVI